MSQSVATPKVELDQQTKDELQPPCESTSDDRPTCGSPAAWVTVTTCPNCGPRPMRLRCTSHAQNLFVDYVLCTSCGDIHRAEILRMEPLR